MAGELYDKFAGESCEELLSNAKLLYNDVEEEEDHAEKHWDPSHNLESTNTKVETGLEHQSLPRVPYNICIILQYVVAGWEH